jgi:hypothetical protein
MKRPNAEQFAIALEWLDVNNGLEGEAEACKAVRAWIMDQLQKREEEAAVRKVAKQSGLSVRTVRAALQHRKDRMRSES